MPHTTNSSKLSRDIGKRIRKWREKKGLTQSEAGELYGCGVSQWGLIESGRNAFTVNTLGKISAISGLDPVFLITGIPPGTLRGGGEFIQPGTAELSEKYAVLLSRLADVGPQILRGAAGDPEEIGKLLDDAADVVDRIRQQFAEQDTDQRAG